MEVHVQLTWKEVNKLITKLVDDDKYEWALLLSLGVNLPIKIKEVLSLKWEDLYNFHDECVAHEFSVGKKNFNINGSVESLLMHASVGDRVEGTDVFKVNDKLVNSVMVSREFKKWYKVYSLGIVPTDLKRIFARRVIEKFGFHNKVLLWLKAVLGQVTVDDVVELAGYHCDWDDINLEIITKGLE